MKKHTKLITTTAILLLNASVQATNLFPPSDPTGVLPTWNTGDPNSVEAHWIFDFASGGLAPGPDVPPTPGASGLVDGWAGYPSAPYTTFGFVPGVLYDNVDNTLNIRMPNIVDDLPEKYWQIQIHYGAANPPPALIDGVANDPDAPGGTVTLGDLSALEEFTSFGGSAPTVGPIPDVLIGFNVMYEGIIRPNPDFESFTFLLEPGTEIYQVHIDTISIPEPSTCALLAGGLILGIVCLRRRK